jgi:hypothetical protein
MPREVSLLLHRASTSTVRHATDTIVDDFTAEPSSRRPPGKWASMLGRLLRLDFTYRVRSVLSACVPVHGDSGCRASFHFAVGRQAAIMGPNNNGTHTKSPAFVCPGIFNSHMAAGFDYMPSICRMFHVGLTASGAMPCLRSSSL